MSGLTVALGFGVLNASSQVLACLNAVSELFFHQQNLLQFSGPETELTVRSSKPVVHFDMNRTGLTDMITRNHFDIIVHDLEEPIILARIFANIPRHLDGRVVVTMEGDRELAKQAIATLWETLRVIDLVMLLRVSDSVIEALTWFPYRSGECTNVRTIVVLDRWVNGRFEKKANLFPKKIKRDLKGCPVTVCTRPLEPCVFTPTTPEKYEEGYEIRLFDSLSWTFNFTKVYIDLPRPEDFYNDGRFQVNGVIDLLSKQKFDLAFGGMMTRLDRYLVTESLYPHMREYLVWMYPKPGVKHKFSSIYTTLKPELWLLVVLYQFLASFAFFLVYKISSKLNKVEPIDYTTSFFTNLAILFSTSAPKPKTSILRVIFINYVIYALHLCAAYQSSLYRLLTRTDWEKPAESLSEILKEDSIAYLFKSGISLYNGTDHESWNLIFRPGRHIWMDGMEMRGILNDIAFNRTNFLLFPKLPLDYAATQYYPDKGKSLFSYLSYFTYYLAIYVSPGNPLREMFSNYTRELIQAGVFQYWQKIVNIRQAKAAMMKYNPVEPERFVPLTVKHLEGVFLAWSLTLATGLLVFIGEIILDKLSKRNLNLNPGKSELEQF